MGLFDQFPYTNFHELNLTWILEALKELEHTIEQFVAINALKYADPIQWDITSQYEKNTIVIDPQTGTAYISVAPVPIGVALTNPDYWTVVFDLGSFVTRAAQNFTVRWEEDTTLTATFNTTAGEWLVWGDTLYRANVNITAGDTYVVNSNITRITVEEVKDDIYDTFNNIIGDLADLNTTDKSNLVAAINEVLTTLVNTSGDLADLDTTDKSNLVAAINELAAYIDRTEVDNISALISGDYADGEYINVKGYYRAYDGGGALYHIETTATSHFYHLLDNGLYANIVITNNDNILQYGAIADDTTDISTALQYLINSPSGTKYIPKGFYKLFSGVTITSNNIKIYGDGYDTRISYTGSDYAITINAQRIEICDIRIMAYTGGGFKYTGSRHGFLNIHNNTMYVLKEALLINCEGGYDAFNDNICYKATGSTGWLVLVDTTGVSNTSYINYWTFARNAFSCQTPLEASGISLVAMNVCDIVENDFTGLIFGVAMAADTSRVDNVRINGNKFFTVTHGIFLRSAGLCTIISITDNLFRCETDCIYDGNTTANAVRGVTIKNNRVMYDSGYNPSMRYIVLHYVDDLSLGDVSINSGSFILSNAIAISNCELIEKPSSGFMKSITTTATGTQAVTFDVHEYGAPIGYLLPYAYTNHSTGNAIQILDTTYNFAAGTITVNVDITSANPRDHVILLI